MGLDDQSNLAPRSNEDELGRASRSVRHDISTARDTRGRCIFAAIECRQRLERKRNHRRLVAQLSDVAIRFDDLIGIRRPKHDEAGNGAQRDQLLDRLMRRPIFAIAHGIVREDENGR